MDFVRRWSGKTEISAGRFIEWLDITVSKFYDWRERYGKVNEYNGWIPRDFWLEEWEKQAIIGFHRNNPLEGYRRLTFMMLDRDVVAVSPASVWRVLSQAGLSCAPSPSSSAVVITRPTPHSRSSSSILTQPSRLRKSRSKRWTTTRSTARPWISVKSR